MRETRAGSPETPLRVMRAIRNSAAHVTPAPRSGWSNTICLPARTASSAKRAKRERETAETSNASRERCVERCVERSHRLMDCGTPFPWRLRVTVVSWQADASAWLGGAAHRLLCDRGRHAHTVRALCRPSLNPLACPHTERGATDKRFELLK